MRTTGDIHTPLLSPEEGKAAMRLLAWHNNCRRPQLFMGAPTRKKSGRGNRERSRNAALLAAKPEGAFQILLLPTADVFLIPWMGEHVNVINLIPVAKVRLADEVLIQVDLRTTP